MEGFAVHWKILVESYQQADQCGGRWMYNLCSSWKFGTVDAFAD
jgi:hypothetical protein